MIIETAENKADEILKNLGIETVPVDLGKVAKHYGIFVTETPGKDALSGLLLKSEHKAIIGINSSHGITRKRFTIAHELGHYFLHEQDTFVDENENLEAIRFRHNDFPQTQEEKEANCFAAALLMPANLIKKHFKSLNEILNIDEIIQILSEKYEVSSEAMRYRLINLQLIDN